MKFYTLIEDYRPYKIPGNDVTSCFRSAFIEVRKTAENAASDGFLKLSTALSTMQCCINISNAVSKASSNFSRQEYRQVLRLKGLGVSLSPPYGGLLVIDY